MQNNFLKSFLIVAIFFIVGFFVINYSSKNFVTEKIKYISIAGQNIKVDLALTGAEQEKGLSGKIKLKENEGMFFVFDKIGKYSFWMKEMSFPIDIIWIGEDMKVIYIKKDARPELYPESYGPTDVYTKYVLEVVAGFSDKNNLKVGDSVKFY